MGDRADAALRAANVAIACNSAIIGHLRRKGLMSKEEYERVLSASATLAKPAAGFDAVLDRVLAEKK